MEQLELFPRPEPELPKVPPRVYYRPGHTPFELRIRVNQYTGLVSLDYIAEQDNPDGSVPSLPCGVDTAIFSLVREALYLGAATEATCMRAKSQLEYLLRTFQAQGVIGQFRVTYELGSFF